MQPAGDSQSDGFAWLRELGLSDRDLSDLNPCVPGEFTVPGGCYINSATPGQAYAGTEEGTLPMTSGRWYTVPGDIVARFPALGRNQASVARAVRLSRQ